MYPILLLPWFFDQVRVSVQGVCGSSYFIVGHPSFKAKNALKMSSLFSSSMFWFMSEYKFTLSAWEFRLVLLAKSHVCIVYIGNWYSHNNKTSCQYPARYPRRLKMVIFILGMPLFTNSAFFNIVKKPCPVGCSKKREWLCASSYLHISHNLPIMRS